MLWTAFVPARAWAVVPLFLINKVTEAPETVPPVRSKEII